MIIILDESHSMDGDKWESVRYAMQLVTALLDESDQFYIVRQDGTFIRPVSLLQKQKSINDIIAFKQALVSPHDPVIQHAVDQMKKNPGRKKILLFYGDGDWEYNQERIHKSCSDLIAHYNAFKPELYFLKVEDRPDYIGQPSSFEQKLRSLALFDAIPTNPKVPKELTTNLQNISKKIADADKGSAEFTLSRSTLSFDVKFPLKKLLVIYQKETADALPDVQITTVQSNQDIEISKKLNMESNILKGKYFELKEKGGGLIKEGQSVQIELDKNVNKEYVFVIPVVAAKLGTRFNSPFESADSVNNEYVVCEATQFVDISAFLTDPSGNQSLSMQGVKVSATNGSKTFSFNNGDKEATGSIALLGDTTYISVEASYQGYFQQKDRIFTVIKKRCRPIVDTSVIDLGKIPFFEFLRNKHCGVITYMINDDVVSPGNYSLKVTGMPTGITCSVDSTGNSFLVCFKKSKWVCDCMVPTGYITGSFEAVPKNKAVVSTIKPWTFEIVKEGTFLQRCKKCILWLLLFILLSVYLYGVIKKPRFDSTAKFEIVELDKTAIYAPPNKKPRKKLPTGI